MKKLLVGLTGGIGCGKSTVAKMFSKLGVEIIDADKIAKQLLQPAGSAYQTTVEHFGTAIINEDKSLNRQHLAEIIFNDQTQKKWLENLLHPLVRQEIHNQIDKASSNYIIIDIPLLTENITHYEFLDKILVIDVDKETQITRAMQRTGLPKEKIENIIKHQAIREERLAIADHIIINNKSINELKLQIEQLHQKFTNIEVK